MREKLSEAMGPVDFADVRPHLARDRVVVVDASLDLLDVGVAVASDDKVSIAAWVERGLIGKPTLEQLSRWSSAPGPRLVSIVVQPFVLVREET